MPKIAIIGTGWGARVQAPLFKEAGLEVIGISGRDAEKTGHIARDLGVRAFEDWRDALDSDADLVTITTPPATHLEFATAALAAGKHVLCEKPTALDAHQATELVAAARQHHSRIALIDHELRFLPAVRAARDEVQKLGGVRYLEVRYASPARGDRTRPWGWWNDAAEGGGTWGAVGSHYIDLLRFLVGEIESVQAMSATIIGQRPAPAGEVATAATRDVTADDFTAVHLRLRNGAVGALAFSAVASGPDEPATLTIHGEEGALRLVGEELLRSRPGKRFERIEGGDLAQRPGNSPGGAFGTGTLLLGRALLAALEGDGDALTMAATFEDGLAQQKVLDAARRSDAKGGGWEKA